jgi:hypothetical protein
MMTLTGCGVTPNAQRIFLTDTRLIMNVTIGHVFDTHHNFKPNTLQNMANSKCLKYETHDQQQRLAFVPIVANTLGQFGADTLQVLWNLADHQAQNAFGFIIDSPANVALVQCSPPSTQQENDYRRLRCLKYHENSPRLLNCVFEGDNSNHWPDIQSDLFSRLSQMVRNYLSQLVTNFTSFLRVLARSVFISRFESQSE